MARKMKDSGVEWIGMIPENWNSIKVKYVYEIKKAKLPTKFFSDNTLIPYMSMEYIRNPLIIPQYAKDGDYCSKDDLLLLWDGSNAGEIIFNHPEGYAPSTTAILKLLIKQNKVFMKYYMKFLEEELRKNTNGMGIPHVNGEFLKNSKIVIATLNEQQEIAHFLDKKVKQIDSVITKTKETIEDYKKYKQAIITEAVTKGLNPNIEMKYSGVEWIGSIPQEWNIWKLKYLLKTPMQYGANEIGILYEEKLPRYIRITDITSDNKLKITGKLSLTEEMAKDFILKDGDILFARSGGTVGKSFIYKAHYGRCAFAGYLIKATIGKKLLPQYVYYYTLTNSYESWKNRIFIQSTIQNIGADKYSNMEIVIPNTISQQQNIIKYLDKKCYDIDKLIAKKEELLADLESYKKSLIYEYVTGKKEIY